MSERAIESEDLRRENRRLRVELEKLRVRLDERDDVLRAIGQGEVDAFVVSGPAGENIYSLRSPDILYRAMIEDMQEGAVTLDRSGTIIYANSYFATLMHAARERLAGTSIRVFIANESEAFLAALDREDRATSLRQELMLARADGKLVPVHATMNRLVLDDIEVFCVIVTDLTQQRQRDELLIESRRKDEFLAMLAHELRNPIAPIRNAAEVLRLKTAGDPGARWADGAIDVIDRQVRQLGRLVDDLLDVARITRGKIRLERKKVDLESVVSQAIETARPAIEAHQHRLTTSLPRERLWVEGDPTRLGQVVSNLLNNAAKFTPDRGEVALSIDREGDEACIRVKDCGIGIAPHLLPHIFDLFTQADATLERSQGGLGIGLTLVRSLVEMHGGTVTASSAGLGKGSEFSVRIPLSEGVIDEPRAPQHPMPAPDGQGLRILVVDDNVDAGESQVMLLEDLGYEARMVTDGQRALDEARAFRPHVMLVDIGLPVMNGYEVARRVREDGVLAPGLVLVAVTGYGSEEHHRRSMEAGFDHHWVKPLDLEKLQALLADVAARATQFAPTPGH